MNNSVQSSQRPPLCWQHERCASLVLLSFLSPRGLAQCHDGLSFRPRLLLLLCSVPALHPFQVVSVLPAALAVAKGPLPDYQLCLSASQSDCACPARLLLLLCAFQPF